MIRDGDPFTFDGAARMAGVVQWLNERGMTNRAPRWFHGGSPGLRPGDMLVPFEVADPVHGGDWWVDEADRVTDRVFVTTSPGIAWIYAANHQQGWVYEVEPIGPVVPDNEWPGAGAGIAFQTPKARVLRGMLVPDDARRTLRAMHGDRYGGWVTCSDGRVRWGEHGAAGVLFRHAPSGRFYLHRRAATVDHPGTWALPGGALHEGETPVEGALREAAEEIGELPEVEVTGTYPYSVGDWTYTVVMADVPERFFAEPDRGESDVDGWFKADKLAKRRLHPDLARCLAQMMQAPPLVSRVTDDLWIGGVDDGEPLPADFAHVVAVCPQDQGRYALGPDTDLSEYGLLDTDELPDENLILSIADRVNDLRRDGSTLVHCELGLNRSGLVAATALVLDGMDPAEAIDLLRQRRSHLVLSNSTFERWVREVASAKIGAVA